MSVNQPTWQQKKWTVKKGPIFIIFINTHKGTFQTNAAQPPSITKICQIKCIPLVSLHKWNHAERIDNTTAHDPSQKRLVISEPVWNEHDGAPSDDEVQRIVYRSEPAWSEHTYDGDPRYDERPLHTEQHYSKHIFPVHKVHRSKCSAYQQIYRGIVKSSPDTLDC